MSNDTDNCSFGNVVYRSDISHSSEKATTSTPPPTEVELTHFLSSRNVMQPRHAGKRSGYLAVAFSQWCLENKPPQGSSKDVMSKYATTRKTFSRPYSRCLWELSTALYEHVRVGKDTYLDRKGLLNLEVRLPAYQVYVFAHKRGELSKSSFLLWKGKVASVQKIYLELIMCGNNIGFYNAITNIKAFLGGKTLCEGCNRTFTHGLHKCKSCCQQCQYVPPCSAEESVVACTACNREFFGERCWKNHEGVICQGKKRCVACKADYLVRHGQHKCCVLMAIP